MFDPTEIREEPLYPDAGFRGAFPSVQGNPASPHLPIKIVIVDTGVFKAESVYPTPHRS